MKQLDNTDKQKYKKFNQRNKKNYSKGEHSSGNKTKKEKNIGFTLGKGIFANIDIDSLPKG